MDNESKLRRAIVEELGRCHSEEAIETYWRILSKLDRGIIKLDKKYTDDMDMDVFIEDDYCCMPNNVMRVMVSIKSIENGVSCGVYETLDKDRCTLDKDRCTLEEDNGKSVQEDIE